MTATHEKHKYTNRLINETSPYLLQHAHNPVDWYPWGDEAFQKAKKEDKPVLLSVGYAACHWCHVMERESFENEAIAAIMNQSFVSIKVDREERPDVDGIYMQAVQAMTQHGGWPMTVFLFPDGRPFYGGTYFPPQDRMYGPNTRMPGFMTILHSVASAYREHRNELEEQATELADYLRQRSNIPLRQRAIAVQGKEMPLNSLLPAVQTLERQFDEINGGFGDAPKFPSTMSLEFLLRMHLHRQANEIDAALEHGHPTELEMVENTLQHMANGGIYDQLGGGFHRYSVDDHWLVPHFEKMLYDNALLSRLYLHTYLVTGNNFYRRIVEETLDYVVREMTSPEGGFYSTQDADSEGEEGKFFLWVPEEIQAALSPQDAAIFMQYYDVTTKGNFEGKNILHVTRELYQVADDANIGLENAEDALRRARATLFALREKRVKPGRDEKILTSWNGLMLRSFAEAARHLQRLDYLQIAHRNADFLLATLRTEQGRILRTYKDGHAHLNGYLEDYVFLADGLLALYEASGEEKWFQEARTLMDQAIALFADEENGGFFDTGHDHETLISRPKDIMDNATPAGNSVASDVLLHLASLTGEVAYRQRADEYLRSLSETAIKLPQAFGHVLCVLDYALSPVKEIAIIGDPLAPVTQALLDVVNHRYLPNSVLAWTSEESIQAGTAVELLVGRTTQQGRPTAYVCQNFACQAPVTGAEDLESLL